MRVVLLPDCIFRIDIRYSKKVVHPDEFRNINH